MIGVGVIGYGYAGKILHCPLIAQTEGLRLTAVASRDASRREQARQQWNVPVYERPEELLADKRMTRVVWGGGAKDISLVSECRRDVLARVRDMGDVGAVERGEIGECRRRFLCVGVCGVGSGNEPSNALHTS